MLEKAPQRIGDPIAYLIGKAMRKGHTHSR